MSDPIEVQAPESTEPLSESSALAAVSELLRGPEKAPPETPPADESQPPEDQAPAWDLKSVAEKLGADPAKLYESLKVAMADGEELSVSALKDAYKPVAEMHKARAALTEEMVSSRTQVEQARQELGQLVGLIGPQNVSPELLREVSRLAEVQRLAESQALLKAIPEWKDPITRAADWTDIRKVAGEYGYTEADIKLAEQGYADHRLLKMARDLAHARPAQVKPAPKVAAAPKAGKPQTEAQQFGRIKSAVTSGRLSKVAAVEQILRSK